MWDHCAAMRDTDPVASLLEPGRRDLDVPVSSLDPRGRSARRAGLAAVLLVGALGVAIASGVLSRAGTAPAGPSPSTVAAAPSGTATPAPRATLVEPSFPSSLPLTMPDLATISFGDLADRVLEGNLVDRIVLTPGPLVVRQTPCFTIEGNCAELSIPGLALVVTPAPDLIPWDRDPAPGSTLVLQVREGSLVFLGALAPDPPAPVTISTLLENPFRQLSMVDLYLVNGGLLRAAYATCRTAALDSCARAASLLDLSSGEPAGAGPNEPVTLAGDPAGFPASGIDGATGTFLVRRVFRPACAGRPPGGDAPCDQQFVIGPQVVGMLVPGLGYRTTASPAGSLTAQVVDSEGRPMPGFAVHLDAASGAATIRSRSDAAGRVRFDGLAPGLWWVSVIETHSTGDFAIGELQTQVESGGTTDEILMVTPGVPWMGG